MSVGIRILSATLVQALKIFFDEQLQSRLRQGLDAHLIAFNPLRHHMHGDYHANSLTIESGRRCLGVERALQQINEGASGPELNQRLLASPVAELLPSW